MLKWNYAIHLALAGLLGVPALVVQAPAPASTPPTSPTSLDRRASLERSLDDTLRALEVLAGFESRAAAGESPASALVRQATEPAIPGERERDAQLAALREEVSRLQMLHDEIDAAAARAAGVQAGAMAAAAADDSAARRTALVPTTGLGEEERRALATPLPPATPAGPPLIVSPVSQASAVEASAVAVADPLRQGQACYRAGRYAECLTLMRSLGLDVTAQYWAGRALEKLDRIDEAIAAYSAVAAAPGAGYLATRAANDVEYLRWKTGFANRRAQRETSPASTTNEEGDAP